MQGRDAIAGASGGGRRRQRWNYARGEDELAQIYAHLRQVF